MRKGRRGIEKEVKYIEKSIVIKSIKGIENGLRNILRKQKKYEENPELYSNYKQANTARTIAIVALVLSSAFFVYCLVRYLFFGGPEAVDVFWEEYQKQLEIQSQS